MINILIILFSMKKISYIIIILTVFILLIKESDLHAQLPNHNTYLLAQINNYPGYSGLWGYVAPDSSEYALLGCFNGTSFVNITDSSDIHEVDFIPGVNSGWREIKTYSHYAYVVSEGTNSRLQIIDLQYLPDSVSLITSWNYSGFTQAHNISRSGPYLYISGGNASPNGGVQIIDITDPVNPVRRGNNTVRYVHDCRVSNDTIWGTNINNQKISIMNGVNKDNVTEIRNFNTLQSMPHNLTFSPDKKYIYVTYENETPGMLDIWNVEDLENITYIRSWQPTGIETAITHNVEVFGNYAIVAHYTAGIRILDLTNPSNPLEVAWYDTRPQDNSTNFLGCWAVYKFPSGKIIGSDITNGLFVIKTTIPTLSENINSKVPEKFILHQNYPNPFNPVTNLEFEIPESGFVSLKVFDMLGKETADLVNEKLSPGKYTVTFSGSELASGVYFYKLKYTGQGSINEKVKKMLIVR